MRARRIDSTATALIAYAKSIGFDYVPINDMIDGLLVLGQTVIIVDWKSQGGDLTPSQSRLIARGVPVRFIQRPEQLDALKDKAKSSGLEEIEGLIFKVSIGKSIRSSLDTASVKKELGQQWYDDHCKLAEVTTVRIKPRAEALASL